MVRSFGYAAAKIWTKITNLSDYGINFLFLISIIFDIFNNSRPNEKQQF